MTSIPENIVNNKVNLNADIQVNISYPKPPDDMYYSMVFIYSFEMVKINQFRYPSFKFKIWNLYDAFSIQDDQLIVRISLYDPMYVMPSQNTYKFKLNFPPMYGKVMVDPLSGIAG